MNHLDANIEFCVGDYKGVLLDEAIRISTDFMNIPSSRHRCNKFLDFLVDKHSEYPEGIAAREKWEKFKEAYRWRLGLDGW
jgi:hypothetical protein